MPTYEYQCKACNHRFELFQKVGADPPGECPECSSNRVSKLFSSVGVIFKGSGFYVTDYRNEKRPSEGDSAPAGEKVEAAASKETLAKSESAKPAADAKPASTEPAAKPGESTSSAGGEGKAAA